MDMQEILDHYFETALWSSNDEEGTPLDDEKYLDCVISEELRKQAIEDIEKFIFLASKEGNLLEGEDLSYIVHDFWLTRNNHGAGFWDRYLDFKEPYRSEWKIKGEKLTKIASQFKEINLCVENRKFYSM